MKVRNLLLPASFRIIGYISVVFGVLAGILRFKEGIKPEFLTRKVFAVFSSFLENKYFEYIKNNLGEEICTFFIIAGLYMIALSREKRETEVVSELRTKSMIISMYITLAFLTLSIWTTFGFAFLYMTIIAMAVMPLSYIILFRINIWTSRIKK